ncbi:LPXTG cell wall anchor domain-containing protein [Neomicrococcus lactis]|uniref:LPXTG-motif cell wall-anchored protein n=1 Tax=Neomicrococcus lactis TaxID=732241 RepID=A0A7W8YBR9_9MICC|nr:LPXTG cell wall anchor domain-containing protein [Neomicrococcus lactis]MBB5598633.1 LPXTG-motif cell wall-anchored protein [Neomicrococcus lactis]
MAPAFRTTALSAVVVSGLLFGATPALAEDPTSPTISVSDSSAVSDASNSAAPVAEVPSSEAPVSEAPASDASAVEGSVAETPADEVPSAEVPSTEVPGSEEPISETPASGSSDADVAGTEEPVTEEPASEAPVSEVPVSDSPVSEVPSADSPVADEPAAETPESEPAESTHTSDLPAGELGDGSGVVVPEEPQHGEELPSGPIEVPDFFVVHPEIVAPKGSDAWDSDQWSDYFESPESADFRDAFFGAFMNSDEAAYVDDLTFYFTESSDEQYIYEMYDFLAAHFPKHPGLADGMFYVVVTMLIDAGYLEWADGEDFPRVPTVPSVPGEPGGSDGEPRPTEQPQEPGQVPVVKPAPDSDDSDGSTSAPVVVIPAGTLETPAASDDELASTGVSGTVVLSAGGMLLVAAGLMLTRIRRQFS